MKHSAGTLLYRTGDAGIEALLVHASGNYNRRAPWSLPKGEPDGDESFPEAAARETREETGLEVDPATLTPLGEVLYRKTRKTVHAFAAPAPAGCEPRCASWEVDQAAFLPLAEARERIHPDLAVFLDRLEALLSNGDEVDAGRPR
ncbi:NUDIX domain-containing protein [Alienimonas californiensis]|uniref:NUDIX domain protein n=1 Tax=Alienimonas californiensis TaxID=2527989 RepID=A0A517P7C1_9PLAN|nr:NUDIX domain-containing protein [Alienimonas californiensis]QDT15253.1 NUDIX domain protein [Alienimonas californiensis]